MAQNNKLTWPAVKNAKRGMHSDGANLYLSVSESGAKSWIFRYMIGGKSHDLGLGPVGPIERPTVNLAQARDRAAIERRKIKVEGIDPLDIKRKERANRREEPKATIFRKCSEQYIARYEPNWKNPKHRQQWTNTLTTYAYPIIGDMPVDEIDTAAVRRVLTPIWTAKPETASRLRGRIEAVLTYAKAAGWRTGDNPAMLEGPLGILLGPQGDKARVQHHAAMPWTEIGAFMVDLEKQGGVAALALRFAILTAARTGEVIGAQWDEIDMGSKVWVIPQGRMKAGREHRVPLSDAALAVLRELAEMREAGAPHVFPGGRPGKPLSNMAMLACLHRMKRDDLTAHGFRSSFRDWAAERTNFDTDMVELALAHAVGTKVEAAYRRGDMFEKRRGLMQSWAAFCGRDPAETGEVVPFASRAG